MLPRLVADLPSGADWLYEVKLDGYRALVLKKRGVTTLFSRRGNNLNNKFSTIVRDFSFLPDDTIVGGELVVLDDQGKPSFSALQNQVAGGDNETVQVRGQAQRFSSVFGIITSHFSVADICTKLAVTEQ